MSSTGAQPTAAGRASAANNVGGMRTAGRRPGARGSVGAKGAAPGGGATPGQQSSNNIMRFYSEDGSGLKLGPVTVLFMSLIYMCVVVMLHIVQKFRAVWS